jgi:EpsD family peptidyl-prolyl cis-trans isomerase
MKRTRFVCLERLPVAAVVVAASAVMLAGCGEKKDKPAGASQTAAKVNKDEVTVHQINFVLQAQRGLKPEQAEEAGRQVLERLIDQQVALQKAAELKLDRDPRVVQAMEQARREVVARAYAERITDSVAKPTAQEVQAYYDSKPVLFKERKVYNLQELAIEVSADKIEALGEKLRAARNLGEFVEHLKAQGLKFTGNQAVRSAEQLPLASVEQVARMKDGEATLQPTPNGANVLVVAASQKVPVTLEQAAPAIEQFLLAERRRKALEDDAKALRAAARVEYVGKFSEPAPKPVERQAAAAAAAAAVPAVPAAQGALSSTDISKGMGFK